MLSNRRTTKSGFTLPEVLVTVAIVAVLAAVVVPTVTSQIGKGDDANLQSSVSGLRTAITAFASDLRKFPSRLQHVVTQPLATDVDVKGTQYGAPAVARWRGPYQTGSLKAAGATAQDSILFGLAYAVDSIADTAFVAPFRGNLGLFLGGVTSDAAALRIDSLIDGGTGAGAGSLRWVGSPPTGGRMTLLLMGSR